ncbi:hypothetical protein C8R44DRAFT_800252 [Mycena epipterygia]|nr:hypothetical protein C8R44DRAFT_800252 [Mycena epipterygia]
MSGALTSTEEPPTIAAQLAAINEAIAYHYGQISILKAKANSLTPISTLPNELISKVFEEHAFLLGLPFDLKWSKVMLVCRRWHQVALSEQALWGFIEVSYSRNFKRIRMQLERSGVAPLTVKIASLDSQLYASMLLVHAERLRHVDLRGQAINILGFMNLIPQHSFPLLQSIKLDPSYKWEEVADGVPTAFPDAVFDGRAPNLTSLELSHISVNWSLLRDLRRLSLTTGHGIIQPSTFSLFLSVLQASPSLTYLKLGSVMPAQIPLQSYPVVSLPRLEFIWIQDFVERCNELLRHINIPPSARISVYGFGIRSGSDIADLLVPVRKHVRAPSAPTLRCLQLDATEGMRSNFMVSAFTATTAPSALQYDQATILINTHPPTESALRQIMTKILKALPCATITHLDCRGATHLTVASWKTALALLPALEMVYTFVNAAATRLFTTLVELTEEPRGAVFPPLRRLHLYAYVWKQREDAPDVVAPVVDALRQLISVRHAHGTPLEVLEIDEQLSSLDMQEAEWEAMFELVGTLIRDGEVYDPPARRREEEDWRREWELANQDSN